MLIYFAPCNIITECKKVEMNNTILKEAIPGDNVGFSIKDNNMINIKRVYVVGDPKNDPTKEVESFKAQVIFINHSQSIKAGYCPIIDCHTSQISVKFSKLEAKIDRRNGKIIEKEPKEIKNGEYAIAFMEPQKPFVCEAYRIFPSFGRFTVRDMKMTVAIGIIREINRKKENKNITKNNKKEMLNIEKEEVKIEMSNNEKLGNQNQKINNEVIKEENTKKKF